MNKIKLHQIGSGIDDVWVFDGYSLLTSGKFTIESELQRLIDEFWARHYSVSIDVARIIRKILLKQHQNDFWLFVIESLGADKDRFIQETYMSVDLHRCDIVEDTQLRKVLVEICAPKYVVADTYDVFMRRILRQLGVEDLFVDVYGISAQREISASTSFSALGHVTDFLMEGKKVLYLDVDLEHIKFADSIGALTVHVTSIGIYQAPAYYTYAVKSADVYPLGRKEELCARLGFSVVRDMSRKTSLGCLYEVKNEHGEMFLMKIAENNPSSVFWLRDFLQGHEYMSALGLGEYVPKVLSSTLSESIPYILMEGCGYDFETLVQKSDTPQDVYDLFVLRMGELYEKSVFEGSGTLYEYVCNTVISVLKQDHYRSLASVASSIEEADRILGAVVDRVSLISGKKMTFSVCELAPEEIYLGKDSMKLLGTYCVFVGVPMVDLGYVTGKISYAYKLNGFEYGYYVTKSLALNLATLLSVSREDADVLFDLGLVLQCFDSGKSEFSFCRERQNEMYQRGLSHLRKIGNSSLEGK